VNNFATIDLPISASAGHALDFLLAFFILFRDGVNIDCAVVLDVDLATDSRRSVLIFLPPGPMRAPIFSGLIFTVTMRGAYLLSSCAGLKGLGISARTCRRATRACSSLRHDFVRDARPFQPRQGDEQIRSRIVTVKINPEKIGRSHRSRCKNIKRIVEESGCEIKSRMTAQSIFTPSLKRG